MMSGLQASVIAVLALLCAAAGVTLLRGRRSGEMRSMAVAWPHTRGTVLSATVQVNHTHRSRHEAPLVVYAYQVNGEMFQGHRVRTNGAPDNASATLARYPAGASVIVYYDPEDPANSALER